MAQPKTGPTGYYEDRDVAVSYDRRVTAPDSLSRARAMAQVLRHYTALTRDSLCLSVGCGTGVKEQFVPSHRLVCFDLSREMLKLAADRVSHRVQGTVMQLPFPDDTFDCVFAIDLSTLHYSEQMANDTIREMARVTRPGGTVLTMTTNAFSKKVIHFILHRNFHYDPYLMKNRIIRRAFRASGLKTTRRFNIWSPRVRSLRTNAWLQKVKLDFLGSPFVCCGMKVRPRT